MSAVLAVHGASAGYGRTLAIRDISLVVAPGEIVAVVGESGSGKSTLAKLLTGQIHPAHGEVLVEGRPWRSISARHDARHHVQMIFQDSRDALNPWMTALETVTEAVQVVDGVRRSAAVGRARELLEQMGLTGSVVDRRPGRLSGGQCQRVGIARSLAHRPRVLIADEPTSALDVSVQAQVLTLLRRLRAEEGMAIVLITHDLNVVSSVADRVFVLYQGHAMEAGATDAVMAAPAHPYTRLLLDSQPGVAGMLPVMTGDAPGHPCPFAGRCPLRQPDCVHLDHTSFFSAPADGEHEAACLHPLNSATARLPVPHDPEG